MAQTKICPICKKRVEEGMIDTCESAYKYVIDSIKRDHPNWVEKDGACPKCVEYYKKM
ncbi:MAG TPA: hypothetical protein PLC32_02740 [Candidatus Omnitrophota bacterium]|nr:hypothetical protein [Candidatus Omnitrophota bacterium]